MLHLRKVSYFSVFCNSENLQFIDEYPCFERLGQMLCKERGSLKLTSASSLSCDMSCEEVSYQT